MSRQPPVFPDLRHYRVVPWLPALAGCLLAVAVVMPRSAAWGMACLAATLAAGAHPLKIEVGNFIRRRRWLRSHTRRVAQGNLAALVSRRPQNFRLHVRSYRGFGLNHVAPAAVLEEVASGDLSALSRVNGRIFEDAASLGLEITAH